MPELPEVETCRIELTSELVTRQIKAVCVRTRSIVALPGDPPGGFTRSRTCSAPTRIKPPLLLRGDTIARIIRHGKQLAIVGRSGRAVMVHLGMTGQLSLDPVPVNHVHVIWELDDGRTLRFIDPRRFGLVAVHESVSDLKSRRWALLGPDALSIRAAHLLSMCSQSQRPIKSLLLDQKRIAGIGNIYADEALFDACIHPLEAAHHLNAPTIRRLTTSLHTILNAAICAGGSTIRDYRQPQGTPGSFQLKHRVYARSGKPCVRCDSVLISARLGGRSTVFCPLCQTHSGN